jgi:hypothetical protein
MAASIRFGAQELESGAILPKMVEQQLEGDKVADLMSSQSCGQGPTLDSASSFNFSSFSSLLVFFSNGGYPDLYPCPLWGLERKVIDGWHVVDDDDYNQSVGNPKRKV